MPRWLRIIAKAIFGECGGCGRLMINAKEVAIDIPLHKYKCRFCGWEGWFDDCCGW